MGGDKAKTIDLGIRNMMQSVGFKGVTPSPYVSTTPNTANLPSGTNITYPELSEEDALIRQRAFNLTKDTRFIIPEYNEEVNAELARIMSNIESKKGKQPEVSITTKEKVSVKAPSSSGIGDKFMKEAMGVLSERIRANEPYVQLNMKLTDKIVESIDASDKLLNEIMPKIDKQYEILKEGVSKELPKPPNIKEIETPKNWFEAFTKTIVPAIVGISAMFSRDKFAGRNYFYFNSMVNTIKANDYETFQKLLAQWQLDYQYAKERKENEIKTAELELDRLYKNYSLKDKTIQNNIRKLESYIQSNKFMIEQNDKLFGDVMKAITKAADLRVREEAIKAQRERTAAIASKSNQPKLENIWKTARQIVDEAIKAGYTVNDEQIESAIIAGGKFHGVDLSKQPELLEYLTSDIKDAILGKQSGLTDEEIKNFSNESILKGLW